MCDYKSFARRDLQRHVDNVHLGKQTWPKRLTKKSKNFVCNICDKRFSENTLLEDHINAHHKNILIKCYLCKNVFRSEHILRKHIKFIHNKDQATTFDCSQCSYKTIYKTALTIHNDNSHSKNKYPCALCDTVLKNKLSLKDHMKYQHFKESVSKYSCNMCSFGTHSKQNLTKHNLTTHRTDMK